MLKLSENTYGVLKKTFNRVKLSKMACINNVQHCRSFLFKKTTRLAKCHVAISFLKFWRRQTENLWAINNHDPSFSSPQSRETVYAFKFCMDCSVQFYNNKECWEVTASHIIRTDLHWPAQQRWSPGLISPSGWCDGIWSRIQASAFLRLEIRIVKYIHQSTTPPPSLLLFSSLTINQSIF